MNILLWVLQALLAIAFLAHGWLLLSPPAEVVDQLNASLPRWFQLFVGVAEVLAAVGLTLPGLTRILPWLVVWAAGGIIFGDSVGDGVPPRTWRDEFGGNHARPVRHRDVSWRIYGIGVVPIAARGAGNELRAFGRLTTG